MTGFSIREEDDAVIISNGPFEVRVEYDDLSVLAAQLGVIRDREIRRKNNDVWWADFLVEVHNFMDDFSNTEKRPGQQRLIEYHTKLDRFVKSWSPEEYEERRGDAFTIAKRMLVEGFELSPSDKAIAKTIERNAPT